MIAIKVLSVGINVGAWINGYAYRIGCEGCHSNKSTIIVFGTELCNRFAIELPRAIGLNKLLTAWRCDSDNIGYEVFPQCLCLTAEDRSVEFQTRTYIDTLKVGQPFGIFFCWRIGEHQLIGASKEFVHRHRHDVIHRSFKVVIRVVGTLTCIFCAGSQEVVQHIGTHLVLDSMYVGQVFLALTNGTQQHPHMVGRAGDMCHVGWNVAFEFGACKTVVAIFTLDIGGYRSCYTVAPGIKNLSQTETVCVRQAQHKRIAREVHHHLCVVGVHIGCNHLLGIGVGQHAGVNQTVGWCLLLTNGFYYVSHMNIGSVHEHQRQCIDVGSLKQIGLLGIG